MEQQHKTGTDAREKCAQVKLQDFRASGKERPWAMLKAQSQALAVAYGELAEEDEDGPLARIFRRYGARCEECGQHLSFAEGVNAEGKTLARRLESARFCKNRLCPMCQWRRSLKLHGQLCEVVEEHWKRNKSDRALFLTLTVKDPTAEELPATLNQMFRAFNLFRRYADFKFAVKSWFRALEITYNPEKKTYHPHFHCLLMVRSDYFNKKKDYYIPWERWGEMWGLALEVDYRPFVSIQAVKGSGSEKMKKDMDRGEGQGSEDDISKSLLEVTKYMTKPDGIFKTKGEQVIVDKEVVKTLHLAMRNRRAVGFGGVFAEIRKEMNAEDVDGDEADLVHTADDKEAWPEGVTEIQKVVYRWYNATSTRGSGYYRVSKSDYMPPDVGKHRMRAPNRQGGDRSA